MALAIQLDAMRDRVRTQTDHVDSTFITDAELTDWINEGVQHVWQLLVTADPDRGTATTTINCTAGTELYSLPADFMALRGLDYPLGNSRFASVLPYSFKERNQFQEPGALLAPGPAQTAPIRYRVALGSFDGTGARLSLRPDPGTVTLTLHYIIAPTVLVTASNSFDGIAGFEAYAINWAARLVRIKCEEDSGPEGATLALLEDKIKLEAPRRDRSGQKVVARVRGVRNLPPFY